MWLLSEMIWKWIAELRLIKLRLFLNFFKACYHSNEKVHLLLDNDGITREEVYNENG